MAEHPKGYCPVFGNYPKEYNRKIHGPYYPWVNYGPKDTPLSEVKLSELPTWFARRNKTPQALIASFSRLVQKYQFNWLNTRYGSPSKGYFQIMVMVSTLSMFGCYGLLKSHRSHKYHW